MSAIDNLQFFKDRHVGREGEQYVAGMFRSWGYTVKEAPDKYFPDYDLFCSRLKGDTYNAFTTEVKLDRWHDRTGNVALEFDGLDHSKADVFAICLGEPIKSVLISHREPLKAYAHSKEASQYVREIGKLKSGKPNYACVAPELILLKAVPQIKKLLVPKVDESIPTPRRDFNKEMSLFNAHQEAA